VERPSYPEAVHLVKVSGAGRRATFGGRRPGEYLRVAQGPRAVHRRLLPGWLASMGLAAS